MHLIFLIQLQHTVQRRTTPIAYESSNGAKERLLHFGHFYDTNVQQRRGQTIKFIYTFFTSISCTGLFRVPYMLPVAVIQS